ncbi:MAG: phosphatase PAP2 family protein [Candidatus Izemoplasmatales bacterium]|nr:phosphatase PAP2 family protein [Candidatus Izemoplasmatales bacterium]MDD5292894.1 phosphatase PAP2 family protein [Candidatus Izemoplasmatales bacterium]
MNSKRITYAIIPFLVVCLLLLITYWGNQWYSEANGIVGTDLSVIFLRFNQWVPFIPESIYPYAIAYPFWMLSFFYIAYRSKKNMYTILVLVIITFTICGLSYFFFQTDVQAWRETSGLFTRNDLNFTENFVKTIYDAAGPRNANPSMHCLMSWLCILGARMDKKMPKIAKIVIWVLGIAICVSTQTMKQHYIIDLITALAIAEGFYWLVKGKKIVIHVEQFFTKINRKLNWDWEE